MSGEVDEVGATKPYHEAAPVSQGQESSIAPPNASSSPGGAVLAGDFSQFAAQNFSDGRERPGPIRQVEFLPPTASVWLPLIQSRLL